MMIENKPRPCKGLNKAFGVSGCGKPTLHRKHGLCMKCYPEFILHTDAGKLIIQKAMIKVSSDKKREQKKSDNKQREALKTLSQYEAEAKKSFQKWVRLRDADLNCISCNTPKGKWHGSHYFNANLYSGLIFDERNVNKSCDYCNLHLSGNLINYRIGLVNRYGLDFVTALENDANANRDRKYTKEELIDLKRLYDEKSKQLEKP